MLFQVYINSNSEHEIEIDADAKYIDIGIGKYEYWGCKGIDKYIIFQCDINKVWIVGKNNKKREIILQQKYENEVKKQIKAQIDDG